MAERAGTKVHYAPRNRAAIHRTWFRRGAARQPLSAYDGKRSACDAGGRLGGWLSILRHRAALWAWTFRDPTERLLRPKPRGSYLISTKVGRLLDLCEPQKRSGQGLFFETPSRRERFDYSYDGVMRSLEFSLEHLGLDHVILFTATTSTSSPTEARKLPTRGSRNSWTGAIALSTELRRPERQSIGAGINEWEIAERLARAGDFDVFLLAGRYTLLEQGALTSSLPLCEEKKIAVVIGGPFNSGISRPASRGRSLQLWSGAGRGEGTGAPYPAHLQEFQSRVAGSRASFSARSSRGCQRHRRRAARKRSQTQRRDDETRSCPPRFGERLKQTIYCVRTRQRRAERRLLGA